MQQIIFLYGPPAAGKTTFAEHYVKTHENFCHISADQVRRRLYGSQDCYGDATEVFYGLLADMKEALLAGKSFVYDAVNMRKDFRMDFLRALQGYNVERTIVILPTPKSVCMERFFNRNRNLDWNRIVQYFSMDEMPSYEEGWDHIYTCCSRAYIASPFFDDSDRANAIKAAEILRSSGIDTYLPLEHKIENAWDYPNHEWGRKVFEADIKAIDEADTVIALSYGRISSAGTNFEAGYAFGTGKRVIVVEMPGVKLMSLMLANGRHATVKGLDGLAAYDFVSMPQLRDDTMEQKQEMIMGEDNYEECYKQFWSKEVE